MTRAWPWSRARPGGDLTPAALADPPPSRDPEALLRGRRIGHVAIHRTAARALVWREPGIEVVLGSEPNVVDRGVQPTIEAAFAMASAALLGSPDITTIRISLQPSGWVELDAAKGWQARLDDRAFPEPWMPPVPWAPTMDRPLHGRGRLVAGATPAAITFRPGLEAVMRRIDERCPYCRGTHELGDVDVDDLVYLALGHGLHFPRITDLEWAADPDDGRC